MWVLLHRIGLVLCVLRALALRFIAASGHVLRLHADLVNKAVLIPRDMDEEENPPLAVGLAHLFFSPSGDTPCCRGFGGDGLGQR